MSTAAVYDFEAIRRYQEELKAEQDLALTGSSAPVSEEPRDVESVYGYVIASGSGGSGGSGGIDYCALKSQAHPSWPYAGTGFEWRRFVRS